MNMRTVLWLVGVVLIAVGVAQLPSLAWALLAGLGHVAGLVPVGLLVLSVALLFRRRIHAGWSRSLGGLLLVACAAAAAELWATWPPGPGPGPAYPPGGLLGHGIASGLSAIVGTAGFVLGVHPETHEILWKFPTSGTVKGIAIAEGRVFASTDTGARHCTPSFFPPVFSAKSQIGPLSTAQKLLFRKRLRLSPVFVRTFYSRRVLRGQNIKKTEDAFVGAGAGVMKRRSPR